MKRAHYVPIGGEKIRENSAKLAYSEHYHQTYMDEIDFFKYVKSPWSIKYSMWLSGKMNITNDVQVGLPSIREFLKSVDDVDGIPTVKTMQKYINDLVECGIIIRLARGRYIMNPVIYWKDSLESRKTFIKGLKQSNIDVTKIERKIQRDTRTEEEILDVKHPTLFERFGEDGEDHREENGY